MRRIFLMALASSALLLAAPSMASAHQGKARHHARHAKRHHHTLLRFGKLAASTGTSGTTTATPSTGTPTAPTDETAGTVASFTGGVLTITLKDGSTVSGKVTEKTEIHCTSATPTTGGGDDDEGSGEDSHAPSGETGVRAHDSSFSHDEGGDSGGDGEGATVPCTSADLLPGAVVGEAELSLGGAGAVWDHLVLVK
jgi:hypothetical protein